MKRVQEIKAARELRFYNERFARACFLLDN